MPESIFKETLPSSPAKRKRSSNSSSGGFRKKYAFERNGPTNSNDGESNVDHDNEEIHADKMISDIDLPSDAVLRRREQFAARSKSKYRTDTNESTHPFDIPSSSKLSNFSHTTSSDPVSTSTRLGYVTASRFKKDPYTPLERQYVDLKLAHPDILLCVEVGYKFRFFDQDALTASKLLNIFHYLDHSFHTASIPAIPTRLMMHVRKLVTAGYKVGMVRQVETAALKSIGDNKSAPFTRELKQVYTKGTFLEEVDWMTAGETGGEGGPATGQPSTGILMGITETIRGLNNSQNPSDEHVTISIVAINIATGEITYDEFKDTFMRNELETRLLHVQPCEILAPLELTPATERLVQYLAKEKTR